MWKVMFKLRQFCIDRPAIPLEDVKRHHVDSVLSYLASTGKPMRSPTASVIALKISTGWFLSLVEIVSVMTCAKNAKNNSGLPNGKFVVKSMHSMESVGSWTVLEFEVGNGLYSVGFPSRTTGSGGNSLEWWVNVVCGWTAVADWQCNLQAVADWQCNLQAADWQCNLQFRELLIPYDIWDIAGHQSCARHCSWTLCSCRCTMLQTMIPAALWTHVLASAIFCHMTKAVAFIATHGFRNKLMDSKV